MNTTIRVITSAVVGAIVTMVSLQFGLMKELSLALGMVITGAILAFTAKK
jgi:hypothetical protein